MRRPVPRTAYQTVELGGSPHDDGSFNSVVAPVVVPETFAGGVMGLAAERASLPGAAALAALASAPDPARTSTATEMSPRRRDGAVIWHMAPHCRRATRNATRPRSRRALPRGKLRAQISQSDLKEARRPAGGEHEQTRPAAEVGHHGATRDGRAVEHDAPVRCEPREAGSRA